MNRKNILLVLKPNPAKFLSFLIISILAIGLVQSTKYDSSYQYSLSCVDCEIRWKACKYGHFPLFWPFAKKNFLGSEDYVCPFGRLSGPSGLVENVFLTFDYQVFFIPHVFYWYLLSCVALYVGGKIKFKLSSHEQRTIVRSSINH